MSLKNAETIGLIIGILEMKEEYNMTVSQIAKLAGVHPNTIRRWEKLGLLEVVRHPVNNYRMFKGPKGEKTHGEPK